MIKILGIDPGTNITGFGLVELSEDNNLKYIHHEIIKTGLKNKYTTTVIEKKNCLQKRICQRFAPSKDLTIIPPKLSVIAPKKTSRDPGSLVIIFILFDLKYFEFP